MSNVGDSAFQLVGVLGADGNESSGAQDAVARGEVGFLLENANAAELTPADRVVDVGCGPGTAARYAARRAATATGVDPDPAMLRLARWSTALRRSPNVSWLEGRAEKLPLPDGQATVAWAISSAHHWEDRGAGISEAWRVLAPGGRLLRLVG